MIEATILENPPVLILTLSGDVGSEEILSCLEDLPSRGFSPGTQIIHDVRGLSAFPDAEEWTLLADAARRISRGIEAQRATVVSKALVFGTQRMFDLRHEDEIGGGQRVFFSWREAVEWLGFEEGELPDPARQAPTTP